MRYLISVIVFAGGLIAGTATSQTALAQENSSADRVTLTEFSDYQCPACAAYHPVVEKLKQDFGDRLHVEYKHFPLNSHRFSFLAARAAEAAKNQDKFLEMHSKLFENQQRWSGSGNAQVIFVNYAKEIGLDVEQFKADLNAGETQKTVVEEKNEGRNLGVNATPTFLIDGDKIEQNPRSYEEFKNLIETKLESSRG